MTKKKVLINNSISGVCQLVITALLTFFSIPVFIHKLGTDLYGVFALVSVIGNLNLFTNLGLDVSLTKFIAEQGKSTESDKDILVSLILSSSIIVPVSIIAYLLRSFFLGSLLDIPDIYYQQAEALFCMLLPANAILLIGQTFIAVFNGMQRIYLSNMIQLIYSCVYWGGIIIVVSMGYQLETIGLVILFAASLWMATNIYCFFRYWKGIQIQKCRNNLRSNAQKQIKYGAKIYASGVVAFFNEPLFKILISNYFGVNAVAYFEIALKIRGQVSGLFNKLMQPLFPYISQLTETKLIANLIKDMTIKIFWLVLPFCCILFLSCHNIVNLWLRYDIDNYSLFINGIVIPYLLFSPLTLPIYYYLMGKNHPEKTIVIQFSSVIVNVIAFYALYRFTGFYSIILSNALSYLASYLLGVYYQKTFLQIRYRINRNNIFKLVIIIVSYVVLFYLIQYINNSWLALSVTITSVLLITLILYKRFQIITKEDISRYFLNNKIAVSLYNRL